MRPNKERKRAAFILRPEVAMESLGYQHWKGKWTLGGIMLLAQETPEEKMIDLGEKLQLYVNW